MDSTNLMQDFSKKKYPPVGRCIYCGASNDLRNEHIIPYGLSGTIVLPESTCGSCSHITGKFETIVLRGPMRDVRVLRKLKSRSKHKGCRKMATLIVKKDELEQSIKLPIDEYPILLPFPRFPPSASINSKDYNVPVKGIKISGLYTIKFGPDLKDVLQRLGVSEATFEIGKYDFVAFAKMIAKIAYSFCFAEGQIDLVEDKSSVLSSILGKTDDIGMWVGTLTDPIKSQKGLLHRLGIYRDEKSGFLKTEVQLFADSETPSYGVILGRLKKIV